MWIYNPELNFGFDIPDDFEEIEKADYKKYHIHEGTLNIFIRYDEDGFTPFL